MGSPSSGVAQAIALSSPRQWPTTNSSPLSRQVGTVKAKPGFGSAAVTSISAGGGAEDVSSSAPRSAAPGSTASQQDGAGRAQLTGRSAAAASLEQRQPSSRSKPPLGRPSSSLSLPQSSDRDVPASTSGRSEAAQQHAEAAGASAMRHLAQSRASSTSAFAHSSSYLPAEPGMQHQHYLHHACMSHTPAQVFCSLCMSGYHPISGNGYCN